MFTFSKSCCNLVATSGLRYLVYPRLLAKKEITHSWFFPSQEPLPDSPYETNSRVPEVNTLFIFSIGELILSDSLYTIKDRPTVS